MALALVSARYPQPSRIMRTSGLGRGISAASSSWLLALRSSYVITRSHPRPDHIDRITLKCRIGSDQRRFFPDALRNQDAPLAARHASRCPRARARSKEVPLAETL